LSSRIDASVPSPSVLVTGGAGFIGKHLVGSLLRDGFEIRIVDRVSRPKDLRFSRRLTYFRGDLSSRQLPVTKKKSFIVHLAANTSVLESVQHPVDTVKANIENTCRVLDMARRIDSERFLFASTAAVYGDKKTACRETDSPNPASPYAASKLAAEYYCKTYTKLYGLPTVILRYFNIYGPGQSGMYAGVITRFITEALNNRRPRIFGDGQQTRDFVYIDDVVTATRAALTNSVDPGTILNIGTGKGTSILALANHVLAVLNLSDIRPLSAPARSGEVRHSTANINLAKKTIQFTPSYQLVDGLSKTIRWLRTVVGHDRTIS